MKFEFNNNIPIYIQIVEYLKKYIISGSLKVGDRLPSVRELSIELKVNPNTMQKALIELEEIGLIYTKRTNGKFITEDVEIIKKVKEEYAKNLSDKYLNDMKSIGFSNEDIIKFLKEKGR